MKNPNVFSANYLHWIPFVHKTLWCFFGDMRLFSEFSEAPLRFSAQIKRLESIKDPLRLFHTMRLIEVSLSYDREKNFKKNSKKDLGKNNFTQYLIF